jgi:SET domain-containing protein
MRRVLIVLGVIAAVYGALLVAFYEPVRTLPVDAGLEARTEARPSQIPGAGLGLFAKRPIAKGDVIGHYGGRLKKGPDVKDSSYVVLLEPCAQETLAPYRYVDGSEHGGQVTRINFAPSVINGVDTGFQNAAIDTICEPPYVVFRAIADIPAGAEIFSSYGQKYHYDFMAFPQVQGWFCQAAKVDCSQGFTFEP